MSYGKKYILTQVYQSNKYNHKVISIFFFFTSYGIYPNNPLD